MDTTKLKKFAQYARRSLIEQVEAKLKLVLAAENIARRENPEAIRKLEESINASGREQVIERVAYIWFNRFCALRFMDVNRYNRISVVSPAEGQFQPEILAEAKMGHIDDELVHDKIRQQIFSVLDGRTQSRDPQTEAYRLLIIAGCNYWNHFMPFLFQRIEDYTGLLIPDDLLSGNSILAYTREAMTPDICKDVEVIGWLYQFYISEKKDQVFDGLKKNKKITPENIPAATQLFTPHWIVRYLVENSLGRLWLLNRPNSRLVDKMDYYIKPEQPETDFLRINGPEEIKICDPACGSGHMLTYAFDLLYAIYEEEGYETAEIPAKILANNLYGIEIDERAGELAAFALTMKALQYDKRFFRRMTGKEKALEPNVCVLQNVIFDDKELKDYMDFVGRDLFTAPLQTTLRQFEEADNFGSLIRPEVTDVASMLQILKDKKVSENLIFLKTNDKVKIALKQADYLSPKYHVVIANPPYMGAKGMNPHLTNWAKAKYPNCWDRGNSDLFALFIERNLGLSQTRGLIAMITMQTWMFLSSFEKLRISIVDDNTILSMAHLGARAFDSIGGEVVSTTAFVISNVRQPEYEGSYIRLVDDGSEREKNANLIRAVNSNEFPSLFKASSVDFRKIPGAPIAYWLSDKILSIFENETPLSVLATPRQGLATSDNNRFVRAWSEVSFNRIGFGYADREAAFESKKRWFPFNKGGSFRRWGGNAELVVNWENDGEKIKDSILTKYPYLNGNPDFVAKNPKYYFKPGLTWSALSSGLFSIRFQPKGFIFADKGQAMFPYAQDDILPLEGFLNSKVAVEFLKAISPTLDFNAGYIAKVPCIISNSPGVSRLNRCFLSDWNAYEISWDFTDLPLLISNYCQPTLKGTYQKLRVHRQEMTQEMKRLEEENNRIFIEAYGLQDELTPDVLLNEITLTCNPWYRYGKEPPEQKNGEFPIDQELEDRLLADTMKEFISYAVGCMFGRYALEKPGLILANQGETFEDYLKQIPVPSFPADKDNVIPMLDGDWFTDDITERFRQFLRLTFGDEHYEENLKFIEDAIGKDIRKYFLKDFYSDHVKRYKKRPIYWLFSSPKGSFNALIYMHRYRPDTVSVILNDYLREFRTKLTARLDHLKRVDASTDASKTEKAKALKEINDLKKIIDELSTWEHEVLYPLATSKIEIDLDDGVKVNYQKFGPALKKIPGLDAKEEE